MKIKEKKRISSNLYETIKLDNEPPEDEMIIKTYQKSPQHPEVTTVGFKLTKKTREQLLQDGGIVFYLMNSDTTTSPKDRIVFICTHCKSKMVGEQKHCPYCGKHTKDHLIAYDYIN